ncbi:MAG: FtsX-like permease family protein, partial [Deltaproteobacteria bacterium]
RTFGERKRSNASVVHRGERKFATVLGITPESWAFYRFEVERGRPFLPREFEGGERVCIVGARIEREMLHRPRMLEKQRIEIDGIPCQVVGVLADESFAGTPKGVWSWKDTILLPDRTFGLFFQERERFDTLYVQIPGGGALERQIATARRLLEALLTRIHYGVPNFAVKGEETNATQRLIYLTIHLLIYATAGISLIVGGINIMNIMLFSVTRRTREIGIRRALGASREEIRRQFAAEAAIIGGIGGLLGIAGAIGFIALATAILRFFFPEWPLTIPLWSAIVGFSASMATGLFFGWMPAKRAAELDPIEALRFE